MKIYSIISSDSEGFKCCVRWFFKEEKCNLKSGFVWLAAGGCVFVVFIYYAYIYCYCVLNLVKYYMLGSGKNSGEDY